MPNEGKSPIGITEALIMVLQPELEALRQTFAKDNPEWVVTPDTAAIIALRGQREYEAMAMLAQRNGYNADQFGLIVDSLRQYLQPEQIIALVRRGQLGQEVGAAYLTNLGYKEEAIQGFFDLSHLIPPVNDLITMAVKGAFNQQEIETFKTLEQFPEDVAEWADKQGLSREWAQRYWSAHWQLPSPQQVFEMLQRGAIDESVMDIYLRAADYSVFWRDGLKKISYNPLTRVDLRRMDKLGTINDTRLLRGFQDIGYNASDAKLLFDFTKKYNSNEKKADLKDLTDGLRTTVLNGIVAGSFTEEEGRSYLDAMGYSAEEITDFIQYARTIREEKIRLRIIERIGDLYVKGRATKEEVSDYLTKRGFTQTEIDLRFEEWDIEREIKAPSETQEKDRDLTKAEILSAYKDGIVTREDAATSLTAMRYDANEVEKLLAGADHDLAVIVQKEEIEVVKNAVLRGRLDETTAATKLDELGVRTTQRDSLISSWFRVVESKVFDLPLSMVQDMFSRSLINDGEAEEYLVRLGANKLDQQRVLALWGDKKSKADIAARQAAAKKKV